MTNRTQMRSGKAGKADKDRGTRSITQENNQEADETNPEAKGSKNEHTKSDLQNRK